jgi:limonene-1,2-epoxide hydrolase
MDDNPDRKSEAEREPLTIERIRELWSLTYNTAGKPDWSHLYPYYHEDILFEDCIQRIEGIDEFTAMCNRLTKRCKQLNMDIISIVKDSHEVFFQWKLVMMFKNFPSTPVNGCTKLTIDDDNRIIYQRDYFDLWGDIFNGIPYFHRTYRKFLHKYFG